MRGLLLTALLAVGCSSGRDGAPVHPGAALTDGAVAVGPDAGHPDAAGRDALAPFDASLDPDAAPADPEDAAEADAAPDATLPDAEPFDAGEAPDGGPAPRPCSEPAKLIYVVDQGGLLASFDPRTLQLTTIGPLSCPAQPGATPFSMGIDRAPSAWVLYSSGELFHVDVTNASCVATGYQPYQQSIWTFGMGFVSDAPGGPGETLFVAGSGSLATIDLSTLTLTPRGFMDGFPELTGTGDGNLWGFFPQVAPPSIVKIDKVSVTQGVTIPLPSISGAPTAWAFAFWGGDFWLFLQRAQDPSSVVYRVQPSLGNLVTTVVPNAGRTIVGAGVSTCAPTR